MKMLIQDLLTVKAEDLEWPGGPGEPSYDRALLAEEESLASRCAALRAYVAGPTLPINVGQLAAAVIHDLYSYRVLPMREHVSDIGYALKPSAVSKIAKIVGVPVVVILHGLAHLGRREDDYGIQWYEAIEDIRQAGEQP